ncbi:hypothetical protein Tco_1452873 [Tanacetum coccineum]
MMVVYCRNAAKEDREFATRVNRIRGDMIVACEERVSFVAELETLSDVTTAVKTAFFKETMDTDDMRIRLLHDLEKEAEERAREKEVFVQKLFRDVSG